VKPGTIARGLLLGISLFAGVALAGDPAKAPTPPAAKKVALVDINSATQEQLEKLPGVGTDYCHHIIMGRPYEQTAELVTKGILPQETYDGIKDKIVAKVSPPPKKKAPRTSSRKS